MTVEWKDIPAPAAPPSVLTASQAAQGPVIPPQQQLLLYSAGQWEGFVQEWGHHCLKKQYTDVQRFTGSGDHGIDIAGFIDAKRLMGVWDNYQCKHYDHPLRAGDVWIELGKMIWYSFKGEFIPPRKYWFAAPLGTSTTVTGLFANVLKLRAGLFENWEKKVRTKLTATQDVPLEGALLVYAEKFDLSIFGAKTALQLVDDHRQTPFHAARFGGGLKPRPNATQPPSTIAPGESRYVTQLLAAYEEHTSAAVPNSDALKPPLKGHFQRQREAFYEAESLRVFARDNVPAGTFEALQEDIYVGVIDTHDAPHPDGYGRVCAVTKAARDVQITANALIATTKPKDRDGICHQLANEERLQWKQP